MISCEKAAQICNKKQYNEASFSERLQLLLHLLICKFCAQFSKKNKRLTQLCSEAQLKVLSVSKKQELKQEINKHLSNLQ